MASKGGSGGGGGLNALAGGAPMAPPGSVASGGGGPPPLPGAAGPYGQRPGGGMYPGTYRGGGTNQGELEALYSGMPYGQPFGAIDPKMFSGVRTDITPGGGNQNAFSPQAATVNQVPYDYSNQLRMALAQLMGGRGGGARKQSGTGDRAGYTTSGR